MTELLAYVVSVESDSFDEPEIVVVHAADEADARRRGFREMSDSYDETELTVRRAPEFDGITDPRELSREMLRNGWWFTCSECERRVDSEGGDEEEDDDGELLPPRWPVVSRGGAVYCSRRCLAEYLRERRRYLENEWNVVAEAVAKWPGIEVVERGGSYFSQEKERRSEGPVGRVEFRFPGGLGTVSWCRGDKTVGVQLRDHEAWEAFEAVKPLYLEVT